MKNKLMCARKAFVMCMYVVLIFSILSLIRYENQRMLSKETGNTNLPGKLIHDSVKTDA